VVGSEPGSRILAAWMRGIADSGKSRSGWVSMKLISQDLNSSG